MKKMCFIPLVLMVVASSALPAAAYVEGTPEYVRVIESLAGLLAFIAAIGLLVCASMAAGMFANELRKAMGIIVYGFIGLALYESVLLTDSMGIHIFGFLGTWENIITHDILLAVSFGAIAFGFYKIYLFARGTIE